MLTVLVASIVFPDCFFFFCFYRSLGKICTKNSLPKNRFLIKSSTSIGNKSLRSGIYYVRALVLCNSVWTWFIVIDVQKDFLTHTLRSNLTMVKKSYVRKIFQVLVRIVVSSSAVELGEKELFGHPEIVP